MIENLLEFDNAKLKSGGFIVGTDEAGRGPGAGPVFAAAVSFVDINKSLSKLLEKVNDSKKLSEKVRENLFDIIKENSIWEVSSVSVQDIECLNILQASLLSMKKSCESVILKRNLENPIVLIDGNKLIPEFQYNQEFIIKGDSKSLSIAAASILAKVARDRFMCELAVEFPQYGWEKNKGYLTKEHLEAIDKFGLTKWHRKKFLEKHFEKSKQISLPL